MLGATLLPLSTGVADSVIVGFFPQLANGCAKLLAAQVTWNIPVKSISYG